MFEVLAYGDTGWGDELLRGFAATLILATAGFALGLGFGFTAALARLSGNPALRVLGTIYTTFVRGTPNLVVVYILFFGLTGLATDLVLAMTGAKIAPNVFIIGTLTIALISGGFSAEVMRGAILAIPKGQIEAAIAHGMTARTRIWRITLPAMTRLALPGLGNVWQLTLKDTSLVSVMGVLELMRQAETAGRVTGQPFLIFAVAALLYLIVTALTETGLKRAEARLAVAHARGG